MKPFRVLQHSDRYLIIYKEEGISFHSVEDEKGVLQQLRAMEEEGLIPSGPRLFPVHRLDKVTSGILVFARSRKYANLISNEFRFGRVEKFYVALSDRKPKKKQGLILGDMERGRGGAWILTRTQKNPAITRFISKSVPGSRPGMRLYLLKPVTGRTHQLRVAMKSLGAPILGDPLYGRYDLAREEERTYLHACALRLRLPDETISLVVPPTSGSEFLTPAFQEAWREYEDPFSLSWPADEKSKKRKTPH